MALFPPIDGFLRMVKTAPVNLSQPDRGRIPAAENAELRLVVPTLFALDASVSLIFIINYYSTHVQYSDENRYSSVLHFPPAHRARSCMCISIRGYIHEKHTHSFDAGCSAHAVRCCCIAFRLLQVGGTKRRSRKWLHRTHVGCARRLGFVSQPPRYLSGKHPILRGLLGGETDEIWRFLCYRIFFLCYYKSGKK